MTFLIYIEGNIGSGKSTFAKNLETKYLKNFLKQNLDAKIIQEPVEEWVKTFDEWNYIIDRWGLFNPPGVNYDDFDIDDELPFDNPFLDDED